MNRLSQFLDPLLDADMWSTLPTVRTVAIEDGRLVAEYELSLPTRVVVDLDSGEAQYEILDSLPRDGTLE